MKIKVIVYEAEERGYWAEVPSIPGALYHFLIDKALIVQNYKGERSKDKWMVGNIDADG